MDDSIGETTSDQQVSVDDVSGKISISVTANNERLNEGNIPTVELSSDSPSRKKFSTVLKFK